MSKDKSTYSESFMGKAGIETGTDVFGYLTLKMPIAFDQANVNKAWDTSNCVTFTWNKFTEHQNHEDWRDGYEKIKKLLPEIKAGNQWLKTASSQVLQEVAKSHNASTKACKTKRVKTNKVTGGATREARANFPGFKSRKHFQSHKYPQQRISFAITGKTIKLAYGSRPCDWITGELPHEVPEATVKCVTLTHDDKHGFSVCLETMIELPRIKNNWHVLVFDPGCKTALTGLRSDGTIWEYDISPLRGLNMKIYQNLDDIMSKRDKLPCALKLAEYWKVRAFANNFIGPMPKDYVAPAKPKLSREYRRLNAKMTDLYASIRNRSKQYLHTMANRILKDHPQVSEIFIGDWDKHETIAETPIKAKNTAINRAMQNNNPLGRLIEYLKYKASFKAKQVEEFNERGTTKTCSECNHVGPAVPVEQRTFTCRKCGFTAPRDFNATRNQIKIVAYGMWHALKAQLAFSSVRTTLPALSCVNPKRQRSLLSLSTRMHGVY